MTWNNRDAQEFITGYLTCALWSSTDDDETPLDAQYGVSDIAPDALQTMALDCIAFMEAQETDLTWYCLAVEPMEFAPLEMAGHDLWLSLIYVA